MHVRLDDWIQPEPLRKAESTVEERNGVARYRSVLTALLCNEQVVAPGYDAASRGASDPVVYRRGPARVVILDGVLGCHASIRQQLDYAVYVEAPVSELTARLADFYHWKGVDPIHAERVFAARRAEEWPTVAAQRGHANEIVVLPF